ncbi:hypothetical protein SALBM135S_08810 [Streptomyces alboniger]
MRLSSSGTFIHGNYWGSPSIFGNANTSHGCIGLQDAKGANDKSKPGSWFYENSITGDVVDVRNTGDKVIAPDNGLNGWNMDWAQWKAGVRRLTAPAGASADPVRVSADPYTRPPAPCAVARIPDRGAGHFPFRGASPSTADA